MLMGPLMAIGRCRKAELTIRKVQVKQGVEDLQAGLKPIHAARHELLTTEFSTEGPPGLLALDHADEGLDILNRTIDLVRESGELFQLPELLRVKGVLLRSMGPFEEEAPRCLQESIELARKRGAGSLELRATIDLAALLRDLGDRGHSRKILQQVYEHFTEGFETTDLRVAADLFQTLG